MHQGLLLRNVLPMCGFILVTTVMIHKVVQCSKWVNQ
jgi:hypothetical protein